jgi:hypothetical protein
MYEWDIDYEINNSERESGIILVTFRGANNRIIRRCTYKEMEAGSTIGFKSLY